MHRFINLLFFVSLFFFINIAHSQALKVGISTDYPPVAFKEKGKIVGIEAELAREIEQEIAMTIEFIDMPWDDLEGALNKGEIDVVMSGVSITDERKQRVDFVEPYMTIGQMVMIKSDNILSHSSKMSMYTVDKRFGVEKNTTGQKFVKSEFPGAQIILFDSVKQGIKALKANQLDYFIHDAPTIWQYTILPATQDRALFGLYEYMTKEPLAWAVKRGNTELLAQLNKALLSLQNRGLVKKIINHWIPVKVEVGQ